MTLLDRYLFGQFMRTLLQLLAGLLAITLLVEFFERVDNFMNMGKSMGLVLSYLLLRIPFYMEQLLPITLLLAGVITLGLLNHHRELLALEAGGLSLLRICRPIIGSALLCTLLAVGAGQWLLPATNSAGNTIWFEQVQAEIPKGIYRQGRYFYRGAVGFYSFVRPVVAETRYTSFSYATWDHHRQLTMLLSADTALWENGNWSFASGQIKRKTESGYNIELFESVSLDLPESPADLFIPLYKDTEMSLAELFQEGVTNSTYDRAAWVPFLSKLSYLFLGLPLLLSGLPLLVILHRKWGRDLSLAVPASCGMAFAAWVGWGALQSMAKAAYISAMPAAWAVHILVGGLGAYLLKRLNG